MTKSKLSEADVKHVARLAQLKLSAQEVKKFQKQLSDILGHAEQLKKLDTKGVAPAAQTTGLENVFRGDQTKPSLTHKEALSGTKKQENGYFEVEAVFEEI